MIILYIIKQNNNNYKYIQQNYHGIKNYLARLLLNNNNNNNNKNNLYKIQRLVLHRLVHYLDNLNKYKIIMYVKMIFIIRI